MKLYLAAKPNFRKDSLAIGVIVGTGETERFSKKKLSSRLAAQ